MSDLERSLTHPLEVRKSIATHFLRLESEPIDLAARPSLADQFFAKAGKVGAAV